MGGFRVRITLVAFVCLSSVMAGCSSSSGPGSTKTEYRTDDPASPAPPVAPPPAYSSNSCGINGVIVDEELLPIVKAKVTIQGSDFSTFTAQDGSFSLSEVTPGNYTLVAHKSGYLDRTAKVTCEAGKQVRVPDVTLPIDPTPHGPRFVRWEVRHGLLGCSVSTVGLAWGDLCTGPGIEGQPWQTFAVEVGNITGFVAELDWKKTQALDPDYLSIWWPEVEEGATANVTTSGFIYPGSTPIVTGKATLRLEVRAEDEKPLYEVVEGDLALEFRMRVGELFNQLVDDPTGVPAFQFAINLPYDFYVTFFYDDLPIPPGYTHLDA